MASLIPCKKVFNYIFRVSQSAPQQLPPLNYLKRHNRYTNRQNSIEIEDTRDGDSPLYMLKIRWELHKLGNYFLPNYKGSYLRKIFCNTYNGRQNKICLILADRVGHLAPSALLYSGEDRGRACLATHDHKLQSSFFVKIINKNCLDHFFNRRQTLNGITIPEILSCPKLLTPCAETVLSAMRMCKIVLNRK